MEVAAFWIALAAVIIGTGWFRSRSEALKHETLRHIVEKTGQIDEAQLKALQPRVDPSPWLRGPPGGGYRAMRALGSLVLFVAVGLAIFFAILMLNSAGEPDKAEMIGLASTSIIALFGAGLFFASRFLPPPRKSDQDEQP